MVGTMDLRMRCYKGSGPSPPPTPPPPSPSAAADNVRRSVEAQRRKAAYGFKETILTSPQGVSGMQPESAVKMLLGS